MHVSTRYGLSFALAAVIAFSNFAGNTTLAEDGMLSSANVGTLGLDLAWTTQLEVGANGQVVDIQMTVDGHKTSTVFHVSFPGYSETISTEDLDAFGKPYGLEGAEEQANLRKEILEAELKADGREGVEVKVEKVTLPQTTLFAVNSQGVVTAIDAESGRTMWVTSVGNRNYPTLGLGASAGYLKQTKTASEYVPGHVAVVNGSSVYCLNAENGKILWSARCSSAPNASPGVSDKFVFVPMVDGRLHAFPIAAKGVGGSYYVSSGIASTRPLVTPKTVSWGTLAGFYTAGDVQEIQKLRFRLNAADAILADGSHVGETLFVVSKDGFVYSIKEKNGGLNWQFSTGERCVQPAIPLDGKLWLVSSENNLFKIDINTGRLDRGWESPLGGVVSYVGASPSRLYVLDSLGQINAVDRETGERLGYVPSLPLNLTLKNNRTDRLYVGNRNGYLVCLRETDHRFPVFHSDEAVSPEAAGPQSEQPGDTVDPFESQPKSDDPFKSNEEDDPFKSGGDDDPFKSGGGDDPFKSGG